MGQDPIHFLNESKMECSLFINYYFFQGLHITACIYSSQVVHCGGLHTSSCLNVIQITVDMEHSDGFYGRMKYI